VLSIAATGRPDVTDPDRVTTAIGLALDEADRLAALFSTDGPSELARLNHVAGGGLFACSADLYAALDAACALAAETDGAFDPTTGPLLDAWTRHGGDGATGPDDLPAARDLVGWRLLRLEPERRSVHFARAGMSVTLDAVARGCVLERAARVLRERGIARARLELAGTVLAFTRHDPWEAIAPGPVGDPAVRLILSNAACATVVQPVGNHPGAGAPPVLDPRTGRPAPGGVSVTVVTARAERARALAEALVVMGRDGAEAYSRAHPEVGVLWLEPASEGLRAWRWNLGALEPVSDTRIEWPGQD
jgi:thiamine biosynthesis lipoprotein